MWRFLFGVCADTCHKISDNTVIKWFYVQKDKFYYHVVTVKEILSLFIQLHWITLIFDVLVYVMNYFSVTFFILVLRKTWLVLLSVTPTDIQTALYELCWQVVQGNLKLDLVTSVLGDMMVHVFLACCFYLKVVVVGLFFFCFVWGGGFLLPPHGLTLLTQ